MRTIEDLRKAAILVASLDREVADELLGQMDPCQAEALRLRDAGAAPCGGCRGIVHHQRLPGTAGVSSASTPAASRSPSAPLAERPAATPRPGVAPGSEPGSAGPLDSASERLIADCLCGELPQTIAVALGQLSSQRASEVVSHLPAAVQTQVLERLVEDVPSTELQSTDIRDEFHLWLSQQIQRSLHRAELAARLAVILEATHAGTRERILENVGQTDARLAKELQHRLSESTSGTRMLGVRLGNGVGSRLTKPLGVWSIELWRAPFPILAQIRGQVGLASMGDFEDSPAALSRILSSSDMGSRCRPAPTNSPVCTTGPKPPAIRWQPVRRRGRGSHRLPAACRTPTSPPSNRGRSRRRRRRPCGRSRGAI